jgi:hypothetical protein
LDDERRRGPWAQYSDDEVREIRASREPMRVLAERWGCSGAAICKIKNRLSYRYVE